MACHAAWPDRLTAVAATLCLTAAALIAFPAAAADLDTPVTATWNGIGLRDWAGRASELARVPVIVDRRLDPDTLITLDCRAQPLREVLEHAAAAAGGELAVLRGSIRVVPSATATMLGRAEQARDARLAALPSKQRAVLAERRPWSWPAGSRPRDLVASAAAEAGIELQGTDRVPHDHLPAVSLPPLTLAERLDLVLADRGLRVDWQPAADRDRSPPAATIVAIDEKLPAASPGRPAVVRKPERPADRSAATSKKPAGGRQPAGGKETFSLRVAAPLQELLTTIAGRLQLRLDLDVESLRRRGIAPGEIVRATVKDATRDQLLDAILAPIGLTWTIDDGTLRVLAPAE